MNEDKKTKQTVNEVLLLCHEALAAIEKCRADDGSVCAPNSDDFQKVASTQEAIKNILHKSVPIHDEDLQAIYSIASRRFNRSGGIGAGQTYEWHLIRAVEFAHGIVS